VFYRRLISSSVLILISLGLFGIDNSVFHALSKLQFGQFFLDMSGAAAVLCLFILIISFVFGRIYCSVLCPLGVFQDIAGSLSKFLTGKKYSFHKRLNLFRYSIFAFAVILFILGIPSLIGILDPYSIYIRGASRLFDYTMGSAVSIVAPVLKKFDIYATYSSGGIHFPPILILATIFFAAFFRGRLFCNTLCPVGMILGCVSCSPIIRPAFRDNCISCGKCEAVCKAECIRVTDKLIDYSRCVLCGNCVAACPVSAICILKKDSKYNHEKRQTIMSIASIAIFMALPFSKDNKLLMIPALSALSKKIKGNNQYPQTPAGAMSWARLRDKCIGCHACILRCPSKVLEPAGAKFGISGIMKPVLNFSSGFCQYDCVVCGQVCPYGAIMPLGVDEKHKIQTGVAHYIRRLCVIVTEGEHCGACAEHCPTGALEMVPHGRRGVLMPFIIEKLCVGCGACEYICPIAPQKAIYVSPLGIHQTAEVLRIQDNNILEEKNDGFVF
jgi:ferredoxin